MPKVLNKRTDRIPSDAVLVDRTTKWGNPYKIGTQAPFPSLSGVLITRESSLFLFREYLKWNPRLIEAAEKELKGKDLVCWCAPLSCHGDVLCELANRGG